MQQQHILEYSDILLNKANQILFLGFPRIIVVIFPSDFGITWDFPK
jgi:hypothetical protein